MTLNVCVAGASGWVGKPLCKAIAATGDLALTGAVARSAAGRPLSGVVEGTDLDLVVSGSVREALETPADVLVEFTQPAAAKEHVLTAIDRGVHVVIGTSGLTDSDFAEIERAASARNVGVIAAGNFAITAVLLERFAREAAKHLSSWEVIDYAKDTKPDAPSGTAREVAFHLAEIGNSKISYPVEQTIGPKESRGANLNGSQVHSIRLPSYTIAVEVIFGAEDERLTIRHDAGVGAAPYIQGTLLAIRKVPTVSALVRGLANAPLH
jgi:4-hydroxy-tetrahydrodipicolinate reductase